MRDLTNQRFGRLVSIYPNEKRDKWGKETWLCRCDCGNLKEISRNSLITGNTQSCGCLHDEKSKKRMFEFNFKHGDTINGKMPRIYTALANMNQRCSNPNRPDYKWYGGRGITICDEWRNNYIAFKNWALLNGYADNLTIDRIDNMGNYEPDNCHWITQSENSSKKPKHKISKVI